MHARPRLRAALHTLPALVTAQSAGNRRRTADTPLHVVADQMRDARFCGGSVWLSDGTLDKQIEANLDDFDFDSLALACAVLPVDCHTYMTARNTSATIAKLADAGVTRITLQLEAYIAKGDCVSGLADAVVEAVDEVRTRGVTSVGIAVLPGTSATDLLCTLGDEDMLTDHVSVLMSNPGVWRYERTLVDKLYRICGLLDGTSATVSAVGCITSSSIPFIARSGAHEATALGIGYYASSLGPGTGPRAAVPCASTVEHTEAAAVRKDAVTRWHAATHIENYLLRAQK